MEHQKSAGAIIYYIDKVPKFLLLKYPTYWGFAKGWIEPGESEEQAARREIKEESSLVVNFVPGFRQEQKWFFQHEGKTISKHAIFFLARISEEQASKTKISDEHEEFKWLSYQDAIKIMKVKANKEMLLFAENFIKEHEKQKKLF